jgi:uncharacterized Zn-binding protein involved in type VI secretion
MAGAARLGESGSGHGTYPARANIGASGDVIINGRGAIRQGDPWAVHCNTVKPYDCHSSTAGSGSGSVTINGKSAMRQGDPINCGGTIVGGSGDVSIGG